MVKKQYLKSTFRLFLKHIIRMLSICAIFVVSIGLMNGIAVVRGNVKGFVNESYHINNTYDLKIMGSTTQIKSIYDELKKEPQKSIFRIKDIEEQLSVDVPDLNNADYAKRICYVPFSKYKINKLTLLEGRLPTSVSLESDLRETCVFEASADINHHNIGDKVQILNKDYTVTGIVREPTILGKSREPSFSPKDNKDLSKGMRYLNDGYVINTDDLQKIEGDYSTSITIAFDEEIRKSFNSLSKTYLSQIKILKKQIQSEVINSNALLDEQMLSLDQCFSYTSLTSYADKVGVISVIFIVFFSLITLLVVFSTMSRLLDEDRVSMAALKTLGYSSFIISLRYVLFMFVAGLVGTIVALGPAAVVNKMIINGFMMQYKLMSIGSNVFGPIYFIISSIVIIFSLVLTFISSYKKASSKPVELLTPKAPKVGKKILLERITKVWRKLSFKYKSTCRNVFLFKGRFFMTFFSIIASTAIVFASLGLFDNSFKMTLPGIESLRIISIVLLFFSAALCALVVYNITNINISERTREIATLMVLGYRDKEITGYIYREIYIMAIISSIVGLPVGIGFTAFVFKFMNLGQMGGTIGNINWWTYILTPILTCLFAFLATLLLRKRILKTNMNDSLKVLE